MKIAVFGLGYVGSVSAACLAAQRHEVVGTDVDSSKVRLVSSGKPPVREPGLDDLLGGVVADGRLRATESAADALGEADVSLLCVGTPSDKSDGVDLSHVVQVVREIGRLLTTRQRFHTVLIRSTVPPGTVSQLVIPELETASTRKHGDCFGVGMNPEFLREGSAISDFREPARTVVGTRSPQVADMARAVYQDIPGSFVHTTPEVAELAKYIDNTWHALKTGFANEIGSLCKVLGLDSHTAMDIFTSDDKLNISSAYLMPGFAFGGSCLPKDVRAIRHLARALHLELPIIEAVLPSNDIHIDRAVALVRATGNVRTGIFGLAFKANTDDVRESPALRLAVRLHEEGFDVRIFDPAVEFEQLTGSNRSYLLQVFPQIEQLIVSSAGALLAHADTLVLTRQDEVASRLVIGASRDIVLVDLARVEARSEGPYHGLCW